MRERAPSPPPRAPPSCYPAGAQHASGISFWFSAREGASSVRSLPELALARQMARPIIPQSLSRAALLTFWWLIAIDSFCCVPGNGNLPVIPQVGSNPPRVSIAAVLPPSCTPSLLHMYSLPRPPVLSPSCTGSLLELRYVYSIAHNFDFSA